MLPRHGALSPQADATESLTRSILEFFPKEDLWCYFESRFVERRTEYLTVCHVNVFDMIVRGVGGNPIPEAALEAIGCQQPAITGGSSQYSNWELTCALPEGTTGGSELRISSMYNARPRYQEDPDNPPWKWRAFDFVVL